MLLLDLRQLGGDFSDLFLVVLLRVVSLAVAYQSGCVVGRFQQGALLHMFGATVVDPESG